MKKINLVITVFILLTLISNAIETKEYKKVKKEGLFGVIDKSTNETVIPFEYKKIKNPVNEIFKVKTKENKWQLITKDDKPLLEGEFDKVKILQDKYIGIYNKHNHTSHITSSDFNSKEILDKIYEQNNIISKIKFYNYPNTGIFVLQNRGKYGFLAILEDKSIYVPPIYHKIYVPDNTTSIFKILGMSYSDIEDIKVYDGYYWFNFDKEGKIKSQTSALVRLASLYIDEDAEIKNDNIVFTFKSKINSFKNIALTAFPKEDNFGIGKVLSYPKNHIEITNDNLKIYENEEVYQIPRKNYEDFYFQDSNTIIYQIKNISFADPNRIFAKKNGYWGIIDKNENVISDFQYNDIMGLNAKEDVELTKNNKKYDLNYENIVFPSNNIFLVRKDDLYNVIDINGKTLVNLGTIIEKENLKQSKKICKKYKKFEKRLQQTNYSQKTTTEALMYRPYSTIFPVIPSYLLFIPETKADKKIFKKALY